MRIKWTTIAVLGLLTAKAYSGEMPATDAPAAAPALKNQADALSYCLGVTAARSLKQQGLDADMNLLVKGMTDVLSGEKLLLSEAEIQAIMRKYQNDVRMRMRAARSATASARNESNAFLTANKAKDGVLTTPSGLQYKIIKSGDGKTPTDNDTVSYRYKATLIDGTEFDSSGTTGQPGTMKISEAIAGLKEALKLMPVGSKWQVVIPPELGYGAASTERGIGTNETLIYELELDAIK